MIQIITSSRYKINRKRIKNYIEELYKTLGIENNYDLNCIFIGKIKMKSLSLRYKKEDVALPVLSFPYRKENLTDEKLLGEVVLCYPQVVLLAAERNRKVEDMIDAMIKHGVENLLK